MKSAAIHKSILLLLAATLSGCNRQESTEIDPLQIIAPPSGVARDANVELVKVDGLSGLIEHGDSSLVLIYGPESREWQIREENAKSAKLALERWLSANKNEKRDGLLRIPDPTDPSGSRIFYFEPSASSSGWSNLAVCAGAWRSDPEYPPVCFEAFKHGETFVEFEMTEPKYIKHRQAVRAQILKSL